MNNIRDAFSMIELIFIILIIGILASVALPRLFALRDDAKITKEISNMSICIEDAASQYTAMGSIGSSDACDDLTCYNITDHDPGHFTVVTVPSAAPYCSNIDELGGQLAKTYSFKGSRVSI